MQGKCSMELRDSQFVAPPSLTGLLSLRYGNIPNIVYVEKQDTYKS